MRGELSERTQILEAPTQCETQLCLAMEATRFGTFEWNVAQDMVRYSPSVRGLFGLRGHRNIKLRDVLARIHAEDREAVRAALQRALDRQGPPTFSFEFRTSRDNGETAYIDVRGAAQFSGGHERAHCVIGILIDVTERRMQELRLQEAVKDLRAINKHKDDYISILAHEIKNPLAPLCSGLEVLSRYGLAHPEQRQASNIMNRQVRQIARLVEDLLEVGRANQHKITIKKESVLIGDLLKHVAEALQPQSAAAGLELSTSVSLENIALFADPLRIIQVIENIVSNSIRHTPAGGRIEISAQRIDDCAEIRVTDSGVGIAAALLPHVFDLFRQDAARASAAGLGIGLFLAKEIIALHGGSISAHSDGIGTGCTMRIRLPAPKPNVTRFKHCRPAASQSPLRRRILVVDDNADAADLMALNLRLKGHDVRQAADGVQAVEMAAAFTPHVIIMDIGMPGMDGREAARRIRQLSLARRPAIIALTGWSLSQAPNDVSARLFDRHLLKPVEFEILDGALRDLSREY